MFEIIGILVVLYVAVQIGKGVLRSLHRGIMLRAVDFAMSKDVPYEFAIALSKDYELLSSTRREIARINGSFGVLDTYEQFGYAIVNLYKKASEKAGGANSFDKLAENIESILKPQIQELEASGINVHINNITFVYVAALASCISKESIGLVEVKDIIQRVFPDSKYMPLIENGFRVIALANHDFIDKCTLILPTVREELASNSFSYFVKYSRKASKEIEKMFQPRGEDYDPSKSARADFLDV